ncbi:sensor histidine kinase [Haloplanus halophilus]|uniref:sensor histidine kinase n=1 Tax=Haloplanus halophilus TaxID=2949993 RepID=UPI002041F4C1|nr:PAS domain-containing sensor histidine kinase [Haloplanus sp. GDY1]
MPERSTLLCRSLDSLDEVFYVYDERERLVFWNDRLNDLFDLTDEEIEGREPVEFFVEADRPAVERAVARIFETGETVVEARADTTAGRIRFELTGRKLTDGDGTVLGFCGIGRDVTERRERERQLAAQNDRLTEFATILAHDLRNPLAVAQGYLDRFADGTTADGTEATDLVRVRRSLDRIERIVEDVLTVAIDGRAVVDAEPVPVATVARDAWATVDSGDATLDVRTALIVEADESRLRRLLENLFRNSVEQGSTSNQQNAGDAAEQGSTSNQQNAGDAAERGSDGRDSPSVTVSVVETADGFAVVDDGPGIPAADRDAVFEPGFSRSSGGTGFGLYIVQSIAEAHGWRVAVTEGSAGGARFEFTVAPGCGDGGAVA